MKASLIGRKVGMTRLYDDKGTSVPITVVQLGPCYVSQIKTPENDGYAAVQIAFEDINPKNSTIPVIGHDAKAGLSPKRFHGEVRVDAKDLEGITLGQEFNVELFNEVKWVDVTGTSKGKGFAGVMKRYHFGGLCASHGTERKHRSGGSIASHATNRGYSGRPKKGKKMAGRMGGESVTMRSLQIIAKDAEKNLLMIKGPVPGANQGVVIVKEAVRLYKTKAAKKAKA
jgi:large subunit ribosomal protein L3